MPSPLPERTGTETCKVISYAELTDRARMLSIIEAMLLEWIRENLSTIAPGEYRTALELTDLPLMGEKWSNHATVLSIPALLQQNQPWSTEGILFVDENDYAEISRFFPSMTRSVTVFYLLGKRISEILTLKEINKILFLKATPIFKGRDQHDMESIEIAVSAFNLSSFELAGLNFALKIRASLRVFSG